MKKRNTKIDLFNVSMAFFAVSVFFFETIMFRFGLVGYVLLKIIAIIFAVLHLLRHKRPGGNLIIPIILLIIPFFWNNHAFYDHQWARIANYLGTTLYALVICKIKVERKNIDFALGLVLGMGVITSLVSWLELISWNAYKSIMVAFMPPKIVADNMEELFVRKNLCGLTNHYSRNAMFVMTSLIIEFFSKKRKKRLPAIIFFSITLLSIGKRAHIVYLIVSLIISRVIQEKIKLRTFAKALLVFLALMGLIVLGIRFIPQIRHTYERFAVNNSDDISTGRFEMYDYARKQYEDNNRKPLGWGAYAHITDYKHPALHSDYLQLYYEVGIFGLIMILVSDCMMLKNSINRSRGDKGNRIASICLTYNLFFIMQSIMGMPHYDIEPLFLYVLFNCLLKEGDVEI